MTMNQEIRNTLRNVVTQCRKLLEDSISQDLEGKYGIFAKKDVVTADPNAKMTHLSEEEQAARKDILDHFGHIKARGFKPKDALDQLVREIAFTHLNRFCAYKMMEAREVYVSGQKFREAVSRGVNSNGVKFYLADHPEDERLFNTGHQSIAYRHFLNWLGSLLSDEIGVLFDPNDPANRLYPRQKTLDEVLALLNGGGIKAEETELREEWAKIWSQDETIGWVYQYFTPKEMRDQARKESVAPRNSYELAFRNQFFTPRYVVEFLTDNTLGRIWYEMQKGDTKLKDQCRYMVRRPNEIFLKEREQPPKDAVAGRGDLSQEELLKLPVYTLHRPKKDPREFRILDPASGSGHFLLYCFDLLLTIYEEAYADTELGAALQQDYPKLEELQRNVPRLILAHNLHGIDIDLRASQIAALALWLRCQRAYQELGLKKDRPKITRSNFVCAEPMPGEEQMLKEFVNQLEPKFLGQVVEVVFENMKLAGEAGSLLKIEEGIRDAVAVAKKQWIRESTQATDRKGQPLLFTQSELDRIAGRPAQAALFDLSDITDAQFFERAEAKVNEALQQYAEIAQNGHRLQRKLFSGDALRGFAFVDICHKKFDIALMNPPYGDPSQKSRSYLQSAYPHYYQDCYSTFVARSISLLDSHGIAGALTSNTFLNLSSFTNFRHLLIPRLQTIVELGENVLDAATVRTATYAYHSSPQGGAVHIADVSESSAGDRGKALLSILPISSSSSEQWHIIDRAVFRSLPDSIIVFGIPDSVISLFGRFSPLNAQVHPAVGLQTGDDFRFIRSWVEVFSPSRLSGWPAVPTGSNPSRFYRDLYDVVDWRNDAAEMKAFYLELGGGKAPRGNGPQRQFAYNFKPGLTYIYTSSTYFSCQPLPAETIVTTAAQGIFFDSLDSFAYYLGILNSWLVLCLLRTINPGRFFQAGYVGKAPVCPPTKSSYVKQISTAAIKAASLKKWYCEHDEMSRAFDRPFALSVPPGSEGTLAENVRSTLTGVNSEYQECQQIIDSFVAKDYGISDQDIGKLAKQFGYREPMTLWYDGGVALDDASVYAELLSYCVGVSFGRWPLRKVDASIPPIYSEEDFLKELGVPISNSGHQGCSELLAIDSGSTNDLARQAEQTLEAIFGGQTERVIKEICDHLGITDVSEYFCKSGKGSFWEDHISRYSKSRRKAPIYWLLQSSKKNYGLLLYYHRLDKDLLFKALVNYVEPKIRLESSRLEALRSQKAAVGETGKESKRLAKELERQEDLLSELRDFEDKLRRVANLHLEPDLNDGVVLNIAPLRELVPWGEAGKYWEELLEGKHEWSSIGKQLRQKGLVKA